MASIDCFLQPIPQLLPYFNRAESVTQIDIGCSDSQVFVLKGEQHLFLKIRHVVPHSSFSHEVHILNWLQHKLPVPHVIDYAVSHKYEFMVLSAIPGQNCADLVEEISPDVIVHCLATGLQQIHAVPIDRCPFDERLQHKLAQAKYHLEHGLVDEDDFDETRQGQSAYKLYTKLIEQPPTTEDAVFTHGDYCLPNILLNHGAINGFIDWGHGGMADRYHDLALAMRSIRRNLGPAYPALFLKSYGLERIDWHKIDYYQLLDEFF